LITAVVDILYLVITSRALPSLSEDPARLANPHATFYLLEALILVVVGAFIWGAAVLIAIRDAAGQPVTVTEALRFATSRALPLMGRWLLAGLLIVLGAILCVIPGLYLAIVYYATHGKSSRPASLLGVVVIERRGLMRCFDLISGRFWRTTGRLLIPVLMFVLVNFMAGQGVAGRLL
jgi:hypothetical protein